MLLARRQYVSTAEAELVADDGTVVPGAVDLACGGECFSFTPEAPLAADTRYTIRWWSADLGSAEPSIEAVTTGSASSPALGVPTLALAGIDHAPALTTCEAGDEWGYDVVLTGARGESHHYEIALADDPYTVAWRGMLLSADEGGFRVLIREEDTSSEEACLVARGLGANGVVTEWSAPACFVPAVDDPADEEDEGCGCSGTRGGSGAAVVAVAMAALGARRRRSTSRPG
jgi:MYXO-CTERM domain-containing protein